MPVFSSDDRDDAPRTPASPPPPRYSMPVPTTWPHYDGPLHGLLEFQDGQCAVCCTKARWNDEAGDEVDSVAACSLRQWVDDDLLLGLVCALCARRYKTLKKTPDDATAARLAAFLSDPPGQRCPTTAGLGHQSRPRRFNSGLAPTEIPAPETWSYSNSVMHSLFLWQRGRCAICSTGLPVATRPRFVHVDHDDATGLIRGLLCHRCNCCLGQDWQFTFWEHHALTVDAYLNFPPAQTCPATRGLTMLQRKRAAELSWSADRREILLDGLPMGIASAPTPPPATPRWYALRYQATAATGLPPAVQASVLIPYTDASDEWWAFLMAPPADAARQQHNCVLRVRAADVAALTEHTTLKAALAAAFNDPS